MLKKLTAGHRRNFCGQYTAMEGEQMTITRHKFNLKAFCGLKIDHYKVWKEIKFMKELYLRSLSERVITSLFLKIHHWELSYI
jgi:hypothetical protein